MTEACPGHPPPSGASLVSRFLPGQRSWGGGGLRLPPGAPRTAPARSRGVSPTRASRTLRPALSRRPASGRTSVRPSVGAVTAAGGELRRVRAHPPTRSPAPSGEKQRVAPAWACAWDHTRQLPRPPHPPSARSPPRCGPGACSEPQSGRPTGVCGAGSPGSGRCGRRRESEAWGRSLSRGGARGPTGPVEMQERSKHPDSFLGLGSPPSPFRPAAAGGPEVSPGPRLPGRKGALAGPPAGRPLSTWPHPARPQRRPESRPSPLLARPAAWSAPQPQGQKGGRKVFSGPSGPASWHLSPVWLKKPR